MLRNRGSRFDTGWLVTFSFFFILVEKKLLRNFLSVAKMASLVYERENCSGTREVTQRVIKGHQPQLSNHKARKSNNPQKRCVISESEE